MPPGPSNGAPRFDRPPGAPAETSAAAGAQAGGKRMRTARTAALPQVSVGEEGSPSSEPRDFSPDARIRHKPAPNVPQHLPGRRLDDRLPADRLPARHRNRRAHGRRRAQRRLCGGDQASQPVPPDLRRGVVQRRLSADLYPRSGSVRPRGGGPIRGPGVHAPDHLADRPARRSSTSTCRCSCG